jgi:hypothetical protein
MRGRVFRGWVSWTLILIVPGMSGPADAQAVTLPEAADRVHISADALQEHLPPIDPPGTSGKHPDLARGARSAGPGTVLSVGFEPLTPRFETIMPRASGAGDTIESPGIVANQGENFATIGAVVGLVLGAATGYAMGEEECRRTDYQCMTRRSGAVVFGLGGFVLGAGVGAWMGKDRMRTPLIDEISLGREAGGEFRVSASRSVPRNMITARVDRSRPTGDLRPPTW